MNIHKNARLTPAGRQAVVAAIAAGTPAAQVAAGPQVSVRTVWKWVARARDGAADLRDRSSRPQRLARQLPRYQRRQIVKARAKRWSSVRIAMHYGIALSTVITRLRHAGLNHLPSLESPRVVQRYEWPCPGDLLHVDIKKLGKIGRIGHRIHGDRRARVRGIGWEYVQVAIDDCSRVAYAELRAPQRRAARLPRFLQRRAPSPVAGPRPAAAPLPHAA